MAASKPPHTSSHSGEPIAIQRVRTNERATLVVTSPGVQDDGSLADIHSAYHDNLSPALSWTRWLEADTFALIVEDPDAPRAEPFVHWTIWNIPGTAIGLPQGLGRELPDELRGAVQGRNSSGQAGYMGPRPPEGHGVHRYHFQLFALDQPLPDDPGLALDELVNMLKAHTLADGEMVATYERRERPEASVQGRNVQTPR